MKYTVLISIVLTCALGCSTMEPIIRNRLHEKKRKDGIYISKLVATDSIKIDSDSSPHIETYYLVPVSELQRIASSGNLTYLGTEGENHFLRHWDKAILEGAAYQFIVKFDSCNIEGHRNLKDEFERNSSFYRNVGFDPHCHVKESQDRNR